MKLKKGKVMISRKKNKIYFIASFIFMFLQMFLSSSSWALEEKHPFILCTQDNVQPVLQRLGTPPYNSWLNRLFKEADRIITHDTDWNSGNVPKYTQAYYSKILAYAFFFSDSTIAGHNIYADEAAKVLYYMPSGNFKNSFSSDLDISETALYLSEAYDMLKGGKYGFSPEGFSNTETKIRSNLKKLRDYMAEDYLPFFGNGIANDFLSAAYIDPSRSDNHHVKLYSALTTLTLAIYNESNADDVLNKAKPRMLNSLGNMTVTGSNGEPFGGWAEGPNYHLYAAHEFVPAINALVNLKLLQLNEITELVNTNILTAEAVMPDGYQPPLDDNEVSVFNYSGILYSLYKDIPGREMLGWLWNFNGKPVSDDLLPDYLAIFDNSINENFTPPQAGFKASRFHPESGFSVLRDTWDKNGTYMFLLSENGESRIKGQAHEHPDPNSIILHAHGEMLLLDSGYGGWTEHNITRKAENHNLILVNGEGPDEASQGGLLGFWDANGSDAFLTDYFATDNFDYVLSSTSYKGALFKRSILFPFHKYFFLYDRITSSSIKEYDLLLHGNGGGTSGGIYTNAVNGGIWKMNNVSLRSFSVGNSELTFETTDMSHAVYNRTPMLTHTVLKVVQNTGDAKYLTLLLPYSEDDEVPSIESISTVNAKGIHLTYTDSTQYFCFNLSDSDTMSFATINGDIITDSECAFVSYGAITYPDDIFFKNGSSLDFSSGKITTSKKSTVSLEMNTNPVKGYIITDSETIVNLAGQSTASSVRFNGSEIFFEKNNGLITFTVPGKGNIEISHLSPPSNLTASDVESDNGHQIKLTWSLSPDDGIIDGYKIYRSRKPLFTEPVIDINSTVSLEELIEKEQNSVILIAETLSGNTSYIDTFVPVNEANYYYWIEAYMGGLSSEKIQSGKITSLEKENPSAFIVNAPYPNPFNSTVSLEYSLPKETEISIEIFTPNGQKLKTLIKNTVTAGFHKTSWNAKGMPSGVYYFKLSAGGNVISRKMILLK